MFSNFLRKIFKHKVRISKPIEPHTHSNVDDFLMSFKDDDLNMMRSDLIGCERGAINEHVSEILRYVEDKCTEEDFLWFSIEIRKEYKK